MAIQLTDAINNAATFADLLPIARQLEPKLSFWGCHYVVIAPQNGADPLNTEEFAPISALLDRIERIVKESGRRPYVGQFSVDENQAAGLLEHEITRIYSADRENLKQSCLLTKIFSFLWGGGHQYHWNDEVWGRDRQILTRTPGFVWDNGRMEYFNPYLNRTLAQDKIFMQKQFSQKVARPVNNGYVSSDGYTVIPYVPRLSRKS